MYFISNFINILAALLTWTSIASTAPVVRKLKELPSTYTRVLMGHKYGVVALFPNGTIALTKKLHKEYSNLLVWAYGPQTQRIECEKSGLNIAMDTMGKVYLTKELTTETLFKYTVLPSHRRIFESVLYPALYLGFSKNGTPKKGNRTRTWKNDRMSFNVAGLHALAQRQVRSSIFEQVYKDTIVRSAQRSYS